MVHNNFREFNFDGLVGPTHNYAGLAVGNLASANNAYSQASPKDAALQGLAKMKQLFDLGLGQAVLPPQPRPDLRLLRKVGFTGSNEQVLKAAIEQAPKIFSACYSASSMWTANAATVSPSLDTMDRKLHLTPANLASNLHRSIEADSTYNVLSKVFENKDYFTVHNYLPMCNELGDEGAANHTRLCKSYGEKGLGCFVYGREYFDKKQIIPNKFPARQTLEASQSIARQHSLAADNMFFMRQNPDAIDAGVFHNDVCAVGNQNLLLCHEQAFVNQKQSLDSLTRACAKLDIDLKIEQVSSHELPMVDMVTSYLFNSQLINIPHKSSDSNTSKMALIAPKESLENPYASNVIDNLIASSKNNLEQVVYVDCRQSMRNGGGPACLRLRVVLSDIELQALNNSCNVIFTNALYSELTAWVEKYYRDRLELNDLLDPMLIDESYTALDELTKILGLGSVYCFQK